MTPESFTALGAQGFNHVPVTREVFADLDTPLSTYIKLANTRYSYLLESAAQGGEKWGRFSVVGLPSTEIIRVAEGHITVERDGEIEDHGRHRDPDHRHDHDHRHGPDHRLLKSQQSAQSFPRRSKLLCERV